MQSQVPHTQDFQQACRHWRKLRKLSQLDLALAANISQRHLSWLENGRSRPSREMVVKLAEALEIPLRERNTLLQSAGFAALYRESQLDAPLMAPVSAALDMILAHHEPLPAVVVDRFWTIRRRNPAADLFLQLIDSSGLQVSADDSHPLPNLLELTLHPEGLRPYISNWDQAAPALLRRMQIEARECGDPTLRAQFDSLAALATDIDPLEPIDGGLLPVLPLELDIDGLKLSLFSVISTFGTPQDVTTDELRIEAFYPTDDATKDFFYNG